MPSLLFICTANRIRSPLAAALLRRELDAAGCGHEWTIDSAGTWVESGRPAVSVALEVAARLGLDLAAHRARGVDEVDLSRFDLILTMERSHRDALRAEYPACRGRIVTLAEMATGYAFDIDDPPGHTLESVMRVARELQRLVGLAAVRIQENERS
ncbi:MAG: low molecular weight phosphotyrosine protein phosphatase [Caldilineaceae bacterium]|nr:low molecular weight phosphotyrosine protein phosphatase [Caldilineaceae bacterium]